MHVPISSHPGKKRAKWHWRGLGSIPCVKSSSEIHFCKHRSEHVAHLPHLVPPGQVFQSAWAWTCTEIHIWISVIQRADQITRVNLLSYICATPECHEPSIRHQFPPRNSHFHQVTNYNNLPPFLVCDLP